MTMDDAFEERLRGLFAQAEPGPDPAFAEKVVKRLELPARRRLYIVGGAGAGGSAIASTQLESLYGHIEQAAGSDAARWLGDAAGLLAFTSPELLAALTLTALAGLFAFVLPSRS